MHSECFWGSWRAALVTTAAGIVFRDLGKWSEGELMSYSSSSDMSLCKSIEEYNGVQAEVKRMSSINLSLKEKLKTCQDEKTEQAELLKSMVDKLEHELSVSNRSASLLEMEIDRIASAKQCIEMELERNQTEAAAANACADEQLQVQKNIAVSIRVDHDAAVAEAERIREDYLKEKEEKYQLSSRCDKLKNKVESLEQSLQKQCDNTEKVTSRNTDLETKLTDVEHFLTTSRGAYVSDLENDYARLKLLLAEAEAERDDLEVQLDNALCAEG